MMIAPLDVVCTGARTPLGLRSAPAAAALRAGINRLGEHPFLIDRLGNPMAAALDATLDPKLPPNDRLVALAQHALAEIAESLPDLAPGSRVPLLLALPEIRPGFAREDAAYVKARLAKTLGVRFELGEIGLYTSGHAGGAIALEDASAQLARGIHDLCVVGGVDSYFHPETMSWLDQHMQLAGEDGRSSFVPGEGVCFLLLASRRARESLGLEPMGSIVSVGRGQERSLIKTKDLCLGEGLIAAVAAALQGLGQGERVNSVICDVNGERYRAEEWGFVALKLGAYFEDPGYLSPAGSWGDMGAASIPLFIMLACQAAARGYARGPRTMVWASSEQGMRAAVVVQADVRVRGR